MNKIKIFKYEYAHRSIIDTITDIASISRGVFPYDKDKEHRKKLAQRLTTEAAGYPATPLEFIPIRFYKIYNIKTDRYARRKRDGYVYTNLRAIIRYNPDINLFNDKRIEFVAPEDYYIIVGRVPFKVISHLVRHRSFSFNVESSRNKRYLETVEFWYPDWWNKDFIEEIALRDTGNLIYLKSMVKRGKLKPEEATMELSDRRLVWFAMGGYKSDYEYLFKIRGKNTGTMSITNYVVNEIKKIVL